MITCVDLFCGLGGLTYGLSRGGVRVVAGIDIDRQCRYAYERNNAARFIEANVRELSGDDLRGLMEGDAHGQGATLLAGCAPCQPFSTYSRKSRPLHSDNKWDLIVDFGRLVQESAPDFVTVENVPQLADHPVFQRFLSSLKGYHVWWDIVHCADYGVPQTRKRLVLLASRLDEIMLLPPRLNDGRGAPTVRRTIAHLPPLQAGGSDADDPLHSAPSLSGMNLRRIRASRPGGTWREWGPELMAECHRRSTGATYPSVYGRMEWDALAPTITTQSFGYGNGRFGHPEQDRAISLREAAMLQTFPQSYQVLEAGQRVIFSVLGRLIGNAVPVRIGEVVAESLLHHLNNSPFPAPP